MDVGDVVLGRKNHYGSKRRLRGEDPDHYLQRAALAAIEKPTAITLLKSQD